MACTTLVYCMAMFARTELFPSHSLLLVKSLIYHKKNFSVAHSKPCTSRQDRGQEKTAELAVECRQFYGITNRQSAIANRGGLGHQ